MKHVDLLEGVATTSDLVPVVQKPAGAHVTKTGRNDQDVALVSTNDHSHGNNIVVLMVHSTRLKPSRFTSA